MNLKHKEADKEEAPVSKNAQAKEEGDDNGSENEKK